MSAHLPHAALSTVLLGSSSGWGVCRARSAASFTCDPLGCMVDRWGDRENESPAPLQPPAAAMGPCALGQRRPHAVRLRLLKQLFPVRGPSRPAIPGSRNSGQVLALRGDQYPLRAALAFSSLRGPGGGVEAAVPWPHSEAPEPAARPTWVAGTVSSSPPNSGALR